MKTNRNQRIVKARQSTYRYQRGAVLTFALVVLLILTILGVATLRTSSIEQMMAGNTQEMTRAFEAAESGLAKAITDTTNFASMTAPANVTYTFSNMKASAVVETTFVQTSQPPPSSKPTGTQTAQVAHFDQKATGTTGVGARTVVRQGIRTNVPAATN
jgi:type IV pilus assembly protein PilX